MSADSKTEKPTAKKRRDERKKGNVFTSKDILTVLSLFGTFYGLKILFPSIYQTLRSYMLKFLSYSCEMTELTDASSKAILIETIIAAAKIALPIILIAVVVAILSIGIQTKFIFTGKNMTPQLKRLNPLKGIKNLFALKNVVELIKNSFKVVLLFIILYTIVIDELNAIARTMDMSIEASVIYTLDVVMKMIFKILLIFIIISGFDYMYQRWDYGRKLMMSKEEVKEEFKQMEGDPKIKGKIRDIQKQRAMSRMMQSVPTADVIIKNPTHFAVALKYDIDKNNAPILIAKGQDELAFRIIRVGEENNVHVIENRLLARALYATTQIGQEIPEEYYGTVAEILVYIYQLDKKRFT